MRLKNKVAIITGAAQGIGASIVEGYAKEGAKVTIADIIDGQDAVAMVEPPEEEIPVEQPTVSAAEAVLGSWTGTANNLRFQLDVVAGGGEDLAVTMTFVQGSNQRKVSAVGQFDAATNVLVLYSSAERLRFEGVVDGNQINGSFQRGGRGRNLTWSVSR